MALKLNELCSISVEELIRRHDEEASTTVTGVSYYLNEIARREQDKQTKMMLYFTLLITIMTAVVTMAILVSLYKL